MWAELSVDAPRRRLDRLSTLLFSLGAAGLQEDWRAGETPAPRQPWDDGPEPEPTVRLIVRAWFENPQQERIASAVTRDLGLDAGPVRWSPVPDTDWEAQFRASFPVLEISPRITIAPPWDPRPGAIIVEPGQGFGTGQHPTTRAALTAIDELAAPGGSCLDVGSGSGILAIAAARLGMIARGIDVDPVAVVDADGNAARNDVQVAFSTTPIPDAEPADLVVANLHAELLVRFAADLVRLTGRDLVLAGILADREATVTAVFGGLALVGRAVDGEWVCLRYRRVG